MGSAHTCRPLLVRKLWGEAEDQTLRNPTGDLGPRWSLHPTPCPGQLREALPVTPKRLSTNSRVSQGTLPPPSSCPSSLSWGSHLPDQVRSHLRAESYIRGLSRVALLACLCPCEAVLKGGQGKWHLHDTWLGALAAGLKIVLYEFALNLPGHVGEAAGRRGVRTNCGERDRMSPGHHPLGKATSCHILRG